MKLLVGRQERHPAHQMSSSDKFPEVHFRGAGPKWSNATKIWPVIYNIKSNNNVYTAYQ